MTALIILLCVVLLIIVTLQIGKISELAGRIRGNEEYEQMQNNQTARWLLIFMVAFLLFTIFSAWYYKNYMLGYGPHVSASEHGGMIDMIFNITLAVTAVVFVVTHVALFWFAFKARARSGRRALFISHDNKLEIIWTIAPAIVMTGLVIGGLFTWNEIMADIKDGEEYIEIEATGYQFAWEIRYPGADGLLGTRDFKKITGLNSLGQDFTDVKNLDDFKPDEIVLPVGKKVRVRIIAKDVLHNFYLPHFRVKMDAVPGMPTYFVFTPSKTTQEYREELRKYKEYDVPFDPLEPDGPKRWEAFDYELACAELCGNGHYSMRRVVRIVSEQEYRIWLAQQNSFYMTSVRGTDEDPYKDSGLPAGLEIEEPETDESTEEIEESEDTEIEEEEVESI